MFGIFGKPQIPKHGHGPSSTQVTKDVRPVFRRHEIRMVALGLVSLALVAGWALVGRQVKEKVPAPAPPPLPVMSAPRVAELPPLPGAADIDAVRGEVEAESDQGQLQSLLTGFDARVMAWGEVLDARDRERPGIPQRIDGEDLARRSVQPGQTVVTSGRLDEIGEAPVEGRSDGYRWLSLALDHQQYALVLARSDGPALVLNTDVAALGRFLGWIDVPSAKGPQEVPLIIARNIEAVKAVESARPSYLAEYQGAVRVPPDLFEGIDDERPLVETRPYYITLGQVRTELDNPQVWAKPLDANALANDFHQRPNDFRGRAATLRGIVYQVWEDTQVAADQPYDIRKVIRVLLFKRDNGPITENGVTQIKSVLRLYEIALVGNQPAPKVGDYIRADGRFVKWRAIPVKSHPELDRMREVKRQSDNIYTMFFVAARWQPEAIETIDWRPVKIILSVIAGFFFILIVLYLRRERGVESRLRDEILRLRKGRRALAKKPAATAPAEPSPAPTTPDSTPPAG